MQVLIHSVKNKTIAVEFGFDLFVRVVFVLLVISGSLFVNLRASYRFRW